MLQSIRLRIDYLLWFIALATLALICIHLSSYVVDDGLIFARVAKSLADGYGWAYNPGEPVNAVTSVIWPLVLAGLSWAGVLNLTGIALAYGASVVGFFFAMTRLTRRDPLFEGHWDSGLLFALLLATTPTLWLSVGLETALAAALLVGTIALYFDRRYGWAGMTLGAAILTRPDAGLLAVLLAARHMLVLRRFPWRLAIVASIVVIPWVVYSWITFGSLLPNTLSVKTAQSQLDFLARKPPIIWAALTYDHPSGSLGKWLRVAYPLIIVGGFAAWRSGRRPNEALILLMLYGVLHAVAYTALGVVAGYWWYYVPLHLSVLLAACWGLAALLDALPSFGGRAQQMACTGLVVAWLVWFVGALMATPSDYRGSQEYRYAAALSTCSDGSEYVAVAEIGYVGFYSHCRVLDMHGLIHPEAIERIEGGEALWWTERKPRYLVTHDPPWYGEPTADDPFLQNYRVIGGSPRQKPIVLVWERVSGLDPASAVP